MARDAAAMREPPPLTSIPVKKIVWSTSLPALALLFHQEFSRPNHGGDDSASLYRQYVVLKPSSTRPQATYKFFEILEEAGLPPSR